MLATLIGCVLAAAPVWIEVRVEGEGYLRFVREGRVVYASHARLTVADSRLVGPGEYAVLPTIRVRSMPERFEVDRDGTVRGLYGSRSVVLGRLNLALFERPGSLTPSGSFLAASTRPILSWPGEGQAGTLITRRSQAPAQASVRPAPQPGRETRPKQVAASQPEPAQPARKLDARTVSLSYLRGPTTAAALRPTITVRQVSELEGISFTLGEVADIQGPPTQALALRAVVLGDTPPLGVDRILDQTRIFARLRAAGFKPLDLDVSIPAGARVVRKGQSVSHAELVQRAIEGARTRLGPAGEFVPANDGPDLLFPLGDLRLVVESVSATAQRATVVVAGYVNSVRAKSRTIELTRTNMPPAIRVGQVLKVRVLSSGVRFETTGRVVRVGRPGEPVTVQTDTGAQLSGTPDLLGVVEVRI